MSKIKVMVSNPMLKIMRAALPDYSVSLEKMNQDVYRTRVNYDLFTALQDLDNRTGRIKVFRIAYPADFYAIPMYITTQDLTKIFRNSDGSFQSFQNAIVDYCAI